MFKLIVGVKGTGKTKTLIEMANTAATESNGSVICVEKGNKLLHQIKYQVRLINTDDYSISDGRELYGFIAGIYASNHDVTDIFIDSALKICNNNTDELIHFMSEIKTFSEKHGIKFLITSSIPADQVPEELKAYI